MADDLLRTCRKTGCRWPAAASLSYRYDTRQVWLVDLDGEPHPSLYDLCPPHADALTVPRGWECVDQRTEREAVREPSGADLTDREKTPPGAGGYEGNRYAALSAKLPELARSVAEDQDAEDHIGEGDDAEDHDGGQERGEAAVRAASPPREEPTPAPVPSRDLAPMIVENTAAAAAETEAPARQEPDPTPDVHEGQLAIPVDAGDESGGADAVVVSIDVAGTRRRSPSRV